MIFTAYMFWILPGGETLTIGSFVAFTAAFSSFLTGNLTMAMAIVESLEVIPLYERVKPIFDSEPEISAHSINPGELTGNIEFSNVSFRYNEVTTAALSSQDAYSRRFAQTIARNAASVKVFSLTSRLSFRAIDFDTNTLESTLLASAVLPLPRL